MCQLLGSNNWQWFMWKTLKICWRDIDYNYASNAHHWKSTFVYIITLKVQCFPSHIFVFFYSIYLPLSLFPFFLIIPQIWFLYITEILQYLSSPFCFISLNLLHPCWCKFGDLGWCIFHLILYHWCCFQLLTIADTKISMEGDYISIFEWVTLKSFEDNQKWDN